MKPFLNTFILQILFCILKQNNFRGEIRNTSYKINSLAGTALPRALHKLTMQNTQICTSSIIVMVPVEFAVNRPLGVQKSFVTAKAC